MTDVDVSARASRSVDEPGTEERPLWVRHPVAAVFLLGLTVRLGISAVLLASGHWPIAPDERQYVTLAGVVASGRPASAWDPAWGNDLFAQTSTFLLPVVWLFRLFGAHVYLGMLVAGLAGAGVAALTSRLAIAAGLRRWALPVGAVIALLPSQLLWSSLVLRESATWLTLSAAALLLTFAMTAHRLRTLAVVMAGLAAPLYALFHLRPYVFVVACWAVVGAAVVGAPARRLATPAMALALMLALPAACGIGVGGITLVGTNLPVLAKIQQHLAVGADSAIVKPKPASTHQAPLDENAATTIGPRNALRGTVAVLLRPFPWERPTSVATLLAQVENLLWVVLYGFAALGVWARRRDRRTIAFPVVFSVGFVLMSALFEGNVGTAFRHRGQIAWAVVLLAACGAHWLRSRRQEAAPTG